MLCFRCGSPLADSVISCTNCGQDLNGAAVSGAASFSALQKKLRSGREWTGTSPYQAGDLVKGRYEIRELVGEGGLGTVYKAFDREVEVEVALKVLASQALPDEDSRLRCLGELRSLRSLVHENIVRTFDVDRDDDQCFYVMQFMEGLTLRKIMKLRREKGQRFSMEEVEPICGQLCRALGANRHVAHGGLKPENIVILPDLLKITDFGLAAALPREAFLAAQHASGEAASYIAPEIREGAAFDSRADVYSIAVILVELLSGVRWDNRRGAADIEGLPIAFERALQRAVSADPSRRQAHASELGDELANRGDGLTSDSLGSRDSTDLFASSPNAGEEELEDETLRPHTRRLPPEKMAEEAASAVPKQDSSVTHQLEVDDVEFASQRASRSLTMPAEHEPEDELLLRPPKSIMVSSGQVDSALVTGEIDAAPVQPRWAPEGADELAPQPLGRGSVEQPIDSAPRPVESGVIEGTQQISADMLLPHDDEEREAPLAKVDDDQDTGRVRLGDVETLADGAGAAVSNKDQPDSEARARDALQAFDFEATLQDKVAAAAREPSQPEAPPVASHLQIEDASVPPPRTPDLDWSSPAPLAPVAPEVLGRDAVPRPLNDGPEVTLALPRPHHTAGAGKTLPFIVLSIVLLLIAGTVGTVYWLNYKHREAARAELEQKRVLDEQSLVEAKPSPPPALPSAVAEEGTGAARPHAGTVDAAAPPQPPRPSPLAVPAQKQAQESKRPALPHEPKPRPSKQSAVAAAATEQTISAKAAKGANDTAASKQAKDSKTPAAKAEVTEPKPAAGSAGKCPPRMRLVGSGDESYCMDRFEYPGQGNVPSQGIGLIAARASCKARGQRLCSAKEWLRACGSAFPYGKSYNAATCNTGHGRAMPSGSKKGCRSPLGIYDLSGNVSEWVEEGVAMGGDAKAAEGQAKCSARSSAGPLTGFRCCADPELE